MENKIPDDAYAMIIGSMKSGTSSLYYYLVQHPNICEAAVKEPEFFSDTQGHGLKCEKYSDLWEFDKKKHKVVLEASTGYTKYPFEPQVAKNIYDYGINPKLIYCVRNPFDRIHSQYNFSKNNPEWGNQELLSDQNLSLSKYALQLQQFRNFFPKESILIIDFEDIAKQPQIALNQVVKFLNLPKISIQKPKIYNQTIVKNEKEQTLRQNYSGVIKFMPSFVKNIGKKIIGMLFKEKKNEISETERRQIHTALEADMKQFASEYNFDVSKWGFD